MTELRDGITSLHGIHELHILWYQSMVSGQPVGLRMVYVTSRSDLQEKNLFCIVFERTVTKKKDVHKLLS